MPLYGQTAHIKNTKFSLCPDHSQMLKNNQRSIVQFAMELLSRRDQTTTWTLPDIIEVARSIVWVNTNY